MTNFKVTNTAGEYLGSVRAKDQASALKLAASIYGNAFGADPGVRLA
jgi:hypothetical protein